MDVYEFLGDVSYDASGGDSAKQIAKNMERNHPDVVELIGSRNLVDFIVNFIGALDVGQGLKVAQRYEKALYKGYKSLKRDIEDYLNDYSDMEMEGEGSEFETFWKRS